MPRESYHVDVGDQTIAFEWDGSTLYRDGQPVDVSLRQTGPEQYSLLFEGRSLSVALVGRNNGTLSLRARGGTRQLTVRDRRALMLEALGMDDARSAGPSSLHAPMPGLIVRIMVSPGQTVRAGDPLVVLEAMKMENELRAAEAATVSAVHVDEGTPVGKNELLIEFAEAGPS